MQQISIECHMSCEADEHMLSAYSLPLNLQFRPLVGEYILGRDITNIAKHKGLFIIESIIHDEEFIIVMLRLSNKGRNI